MPPSPPTAPEITKAIVWIRRGAMPMLDATAGSSRTARAAMPYHDTDRR